MEFPFGSLQRVHPHKKKHGWFLGKITTIYKKPHTVTPKVDAERAGEEEKGSSKVISII